jgi:hypothetical protein
MLCYALLCLNGLNEDEDEMEIEVKWEWEWECKWGMTGI